MILGEDEGGTLIFRQLRDSRGDAFADFVGLDLTGCRSGRGLVQYFLPPARAFAQVVDRRVASDLEEPGRELRPARTE